MAVYEATATAPVNIACIKYWGKRDTKLILPVNSSLSVTLNQDDLCATTTARADSAFEQDRLWLNNKEEEIKAGGRLATCIAEMRSLRRDFEKTDSSLPKIAEYHVHIASKNNFPTAAGLASSAAGFAALVSALALLYKLPTSPSDLSIIARQGSGSACRSLFGGYVAWEMGTKADGSDSRAVQVATREHWPDMHAIICVVSDDKKGTSSTSGMQRTVETSTLLQQRISKVVPERMAAISKAIKERDFPTFAQLTMADSNQFHAVALDTEPPIFYMNDVSRAIIAIIVEYNRLAVATGGKVKAAYTYDAGPNAVIYTPKENVKEIIELVGHYFPRAVPFKDAYGLFAGTQPVERLPAGFNEAVAKRFEAGAVKNLIHTSIGDGPQALGPDQALLNSKGEPI